MHVPVHSCMRPPTHPNPCRTNRRHTPQLYALYARERSLKLTYLRSRRLLPPGEADAPCWAPLGADGHLAAVASIVAVSVLAGNAAVLLGWRYDCSY